MKKIVRVRNLGARTSRTVPLCRKDDETERPSASSGEPSTVPPPRRAICVPGALASAAIADAPLRR